ncbi:carnitine O-palmitoyltransferase I isoform [Loa loa]|uniref:Carnitine O-palmitoyltransferase I isoform n=1 Tax=Loa loa TaxID=7209 RepID=A0A1S0UAR9_LOALO|nr:carnitine O-palmitoyltransferase I isoform [Loa loa]EFO27759.1 carnitine O-palmitoyltransferase I isoform [Loa loa]
MVIASLLYRNPPKRKFSIILPGAVREQIAVISNVLLIAFISTYFPILLFRFTIRHLYFGYKRYLFEKEGNYSFSTKVWFIFHRLFNKLSPQLYSCEGLLPTLPLPSLKGTVARYLNSVEPLLSLEEFTDVKKMAENFLKNEGWKLQGLAWLYWCFVDNYVTDFWEKFAYHYSRKGILINSSVAHLDIFEGVPANQAVRAAHIVLLETLSMLSVDRESLPPVAGGVISLSHLWKCYGTTRVPGEIIDHLEVYCGTTRHIIVYHRGCIYKLNVFDENGRMFGLEELTEIFSELLTRDESAGKVEGRIAALTTDSRNQWCLNRRRFFLENAINRASLAVIESAIFSLILDDAKYSSDPEALEIFLKNMLTGDGSNRWADKSLNYVISSNGRLVFSVAEQQNIQLPMEQNLLTFSKIIFPQISTSFIIKYPKEVKEVVRLNNFPATKNYAVRLNFDINEQMKAEIIRCYASYQEQINDVDVACLVFRDFGKGFIKESRISPDAFVQMAIQLASFKDQGKFSLTYESTSARFYAKSRTETLRSVTKESCAFVKSMVSTESSNEERVKLLKEAAGVHVINSKECLTGSGVDRHLFVLHILSKMTGINSPLLNYYIAQPWELSTSQTPNMTRQINEDEHPNLSWFGAGFQAVCKTGYGISYRFAGNHSICMNIASYKSAENTDSHRLRQHLIQSMHEISAMFRI